MNIADWAVWGFAATVVLTTIIAGAQGVGWTRMSLPYLLGSMWTPHRDRAKVLGIAMHLVNGWIFALIYLAAFHAWGHASAALGALVGAVHALFVLAVLMPAIPSIHPRMVSSHGQPVGARVLEPPGFFALHYGYQTPLVVFVAHLVYGAVLGAFYRLG